MATLSPSFSRHPARPTATSTVRVQPGWQRVAVMDNPPLVLPPKIPIAFRCPRWAQLLRIGHPYFLPLWQLSVRINPPSTRLFGHRPKSRDRRKYPLTIAVNPYQNDTKMKTTMSKSTTPVRASNNRSAPPSTRHHQIKMYEYRILAVSDLGPSGDYRNEPSHCLNLKFCFELSRNMARHQILLVHLIVGEHLGMSMFSPKTLSP